MVDGASGNQAGWFQSGGQEYARFRPEYPAVLAEYLAHVSPDTRFAVDVGCGTGQLTAQLSEHFDCVLGLDPSADQIEHAAETKGGVRYLRARAEDLPVPDGRASLISAAQAAHWFDLPDFYAEARRIARHDAVLALISYGVLALDGRVGDRLLRFHRDEIGAYWPPERWLVDGGYADIPFPFAEFKAPAMAIEQRWSLAELLGYLSTWSAVKQASSRGQEQILDRLSGDLANLWGDPEDRKRVTWPISMRIGRL